MPSSTTTFEPRLTATIAISLADNEFIDTQGTRKPQSWSTKQTRRGDDQPRRTARIVGLVLRYEWNWRRHRWEHRAYDSTAHVQEQLANGAWGESKPRKVYDRAEVQPFVEAFTPDTAPDLRGVPLDGADA